MRKLNKFATQHPVKTRRLTQTARLTTIGKICTREVNSPRRQAPYAFRYRRDNRIPCASDSTTKRHALEIHDCILRNSYMHNRCSSCYTHVLPRDAVEHDQDCDIAVEHTLSMIYRGSWIRPIVLVSGKGTRLRDAIAHQIQVQRELTASKQRSKKASDKELQAVVHESHERMLACLALFLQYVHIHDGVSSSVSPKKCCSFQTPQLCTAHVLH